MLVLLARLMKDGMARNVLVLLDISRLMESASLATLILTILVRTVLAILDSSVMAKINVISAIVHVENVPDQLKINAQCVQM